MRTSHVGSFPLSYNLRNVERVVSDMSYVGLDAPPYPQLRNFVEIYLAPLVAQGLLRESSGFYALVEGVDVLSEIARAKVSIPEAEVTVAYVKKQRLGFKWLRAPVTGPLTLASKILLKAEREEGLKATLLSDKDAVKTALASFVREVVRYVSELGYNIVFLDEPILGVIVGKRKVLFNYSRDDIVEVLDYIGKSARGEFGIHVCGAIHHGIFEVLTSVPSLKYLSLEFHDSPQNIAVVDKALLEENDKFISPGVVSSKKPVVESASEVYELLSKLYSASGGRVDLVSGDCGFGGLRGALGDEEKEYQVSLGKLKSIVAAVKALAEEQLAGT